MLRVLFFLTLGLLPLVSSAAEIISAAPVESGLTIYRATEVGRFDLSDPEAAAEGLALVTETREVNLPAGDSTITFVGVAQTIVPQSASIESLHGDISEINFDYRLISPGDIIADSIGQKVKVIRTHAKTGQVTEVDAILVSGPHGVLLNINGHLEALDCSGENEKIIFAQVPENLKEKPQLSVQVKVASAGIRKIKLSYLATGFDWVTHYVARINSNNKTLNLTAWLTLVNQQTTSFLQAPVEVVAGNISRDEDTEAVESVAASKIKACWYNRSAVAKNILRAFGAPAGYRSESENRVEEIIVSGVRANIAEASELGDYKLYKLPTRTDLNAHQIKQVRMLEEKNVSFEKLYEFEFSEDDFSTGNDKESADDSTINQIVPATAIIRLKNKKSNGLGKALPSGDFTVFEKPLGSDSTIFIGEDSIKDIPIGAPFDIALGVAEDIEIQANVMREYSKQRDDEEREMGDIQFTVTNHKAEPIAIELKPTIHLYERTRILEESTKHFMKDGVPVWRLQIPAGKQAILRYTIEEVD